MNKRSWTISLFVIPCLVTCLPLWSAPNPETDVIFFEQAEKIIGNHGTQGKISKASYTDYLRDEAFKKIDKNGDKELQFLEFREAGLYCTLPHWKSDGAQANDWVCDNDLDHTIKLFQQLTAPTDQNSKCYGMGDESPVTSLTLFERDLCLWKPKIEGQVDAHWDQSPGTIDKDVTQLTTLLVAVSKIDQMNIWSRLQDVSGDYNGFDEIEGAVFDDLEDDLIWIHVAEADKNSSNSIDILEFIEAFDHKKNVAEFNELLDHVSADAISLPISKLQEDIVTSDKVPTTRRIINFQFDELKQDLVENAIQPASAAIVTIAMQHAEREKQIGQFDTTPKGILGSAYVPNRGLVFPAAVVTRNPKTGVSTIDGKKPYTTFRIIKDFTDAGPNADPGTFSWVKDGGAAAVPMINLALRADWHRPSLNNPRTGRQIRPAFGYEFSRSGKGDEKRDVRKLYALIDAYFGDSEGFLKWNHLQIGPVFEENEVDEIDKFTGLIEWEPILTLGSVTTGRYYPLDEHAYWYWQPEFAVEINNIEDNPKGLDVVDSNFLRYGLELGVRFGKHSSLSYHYYQREATNNSDEHYQYETLSYSWKFDQFDRYSLTLDYINGRDSPDFKDVEQVSLGLGIKF